MSDSIDRATVVAIMQKSIEDAVKQAERCVELGVVYPYVEKKIEGILLMESDWERGSSLFMDGLQDERDAIIAAGNNYGSAT